MDYNDDTMTRYAYTALAALAGAVTALGGGGATRWRELSRIDIAMTTVGGFSFAIFVTPWFAHDILGIAEDNGKAIAALTYVFGSGSNILLPACICSLKRLIGTGETERGE